MRINFLLGVLLAVLPIASARPTLSLKELLDVKTLMALGLCKGVSGLVLNHLRLTHRPRIQLGDCIPLLDPNVDLIDGAGATPAAPGGLLPGVCVSVGVRSVSEFLVHNLSSTHV